MLYPTLTVYEVMGTRCNNAYNMRLLVLAYDSVQMKSIVTDRFPDFQVTQYQALNSADTPCILSVNQSNN